MLVETAEKMEVSSVSSVVEVPAGFTVLKLEDRRVTDSEELLEQARKDVLSRQRKEALDNYFEELKKKYVKVKNFRFKRLDLEAEEPGFEMLLQDQRVLVKIKGEEPITVSEFAKALQKKLYHGATRAGGKKRLNNRKEPMMEELLYKRVFQKEALRLEVDKTEEYQLMVKEFESTLLFGTFIDKIIAKDAKLKEEETKAYYDEHIADYSTPKMFRFQALVFLELTTARNAVTKLREGTDF